VHDEEMKEIIDEIKRDKKNASKLHDMQVSSDLAKHDYLAEELKEYFRTEPKGSKVIIFASYRLMGHDIRVQLNKNVPNIV
jgi:ERCC4-related helicase